MTDEMMAENSDMQWVQGTDFLDQPVPVVSTVGVYENEEGNRLQMRVSGLEDEIYEFLESMRIAFRIREFEGGSIYDDEEIFEGMPSPAGGLEINFDILDLEPPYEWDIFIDPFHNRRISGAASPHRYTTTRTTRATARIHADGGQLQLTMGSLGVIVGEDSLSDDGSVTGSSSYSRSFGITVDGLKSHNQYDLYLSGAYFL